MTVLVVPTCSSELFCVLINTRFLGRIQVFTKWGPVKGAAEGGAPVGDPREMLKFVSVLQFHREEIFTRWLSSTFVVSHDQLVIVSFCHCSIIPY